MSGKLRKLRPGPSSVGQLAGWRRKIERVLVTREGHLHTQDDPSLRIVNLLSITVGGEVREFEYDISTTEADEHGRETVTRWYKETEDEAN